MPDEPIYDSMLSEWTWRSQFEKLVGGFGEPECGSEFHSKGTYGHNPDEKASWVVWGPCCTGNQLLCDSAFQEARLPGNIICGICGKYYPHTLLQYRALDFSSGRD